MRKIKDVLRLKLDAQLSHERIAAALNISKGVVAKYVGLAAAAGLDWTGLDWTTVSGLNEAALQRRLLSQAKRFAINSAPYGSARRLRSCFGALRRSVTQLARELM